MLRKHKMTLPRNLTNRIFALLLVVMLIFTSLISLPMTAVAEDSDPEPIGKNVAFRRAAWHSSAANYDNTAHLVTDGIIDSTFDSSWISEGNDQEWIYIDLGADSQFSSANVYWGENYASEYSIQSSSDAKNWTTVASAVGLADSIVATSIDGESGRYIKILCEESSGENYIIKEIEVFGSNDFKYEIGPLPAPEADGTQQLTGGNWKLQRASEVSVDGATLSQSGYDDTKWLQASVPDTVLVSYLKAGAIPDPNYDNWQNQVSDSFFTADFWYRDSFTVPADKEGQKVYLNFDAINWKADIYFNGELLPNALPNREKSIEGAFIRGKFDVTDYVNYGGANYMGVYIYSHETPYFGRLTANNQFSNKGTAGEIVMVSSQGLAEGPWNNGGQLGYDSPTFHCAIGWDWLPTIRGRDIGIYNDVYISYSGGVEIEDPWIETDLNITQTSYEVDAVNQAKDKTVTTTANDATGISNIVDGSLNTEWVLGDSVGDSFIIDLEKMTTVGSITIDWGEVPDTAAYETQNAKKFKLETSVDGENWRSFDAFPGGNVDTGSYGIFPVGPTEGSDVFEGHNVSDTISAPSVSVEYRPGRFRNYFAPTPIKYLRFTTVEMMSSVNSSHGELPPKIQEVKIYTESSSEVGQSMVRKYGLDDSKADLTFRTEVRNNSNSSVDAVVGGVINPGNITFSKEVTLPAGETQTVE